MKKLAISLLSIIFIFIIFPNCTKAVEVPEAVQDLENGAVYEIYFAETRKVLDVNGPSKSNGANITIWERSNQDNQKFKAILNDDGSYTFKCEYSGMVIDAEGGGKTSGTNVSQYSAYEPFTDNQRWYLLKHEDDSYSLVSKAHGFYLDVTAGNVGGDNGQNVAIHNANGGRAQRFKFRKVIKDINQADLEEGMYNIKSKLTGDRVLEVANNSVDNGARIQLGNNDDLASEKFKVSKNPDGSYVITAMHTGKAFDICQGSGICGTAVQQHTINNGTNQQWNVFKNEDGSYSLISVGTGLALDVLGATTNVGTPIDTYFYHGGESEKFEFTQIEPIKVKKELENSTYRIISKEEEQKDMYTSDGGGVRIEPSQNIVKQKYELEVDEDNYYKIKNQGRVLAIASEDANVGDSIIAKQEEGLDTEKWILKYYGKNLYGLVSKCKNLYITKEGGNLKLGDETDLKPQQFIFVNMNINSSWDLQTGMYQIRNRAGKVVDIAGASNSKANAIIYNNGGGLNQKYYVNKVGNEYYTITPVHSAMNLDVCGASTAMGTQIIQYRQTNEINQQWLLKRNENGYYTIISKLSGLVVDIPGGDVNNVGANLDLWYDKGGDWQQFEFVPTDVLGSGTYEIETRVDPNIIVNVSGASRDAGANVIMYQAENSDNARFNISPVPGSNNTYRMIAKHSNLRLAVDMNTNNVYQGANVDDPYTLWNLIPAGNGYYYIACQGNGLVMDMDQSSKDLVEQFRFVTGRRLFYEEGTYGMSGLAATGDWNRGTNLKYYKFGKGPRAMFLTFSIHGWEDSYAHDGAELTYMADEFRNWLRGGITDDIMRNWSIYILPALNPDGQTHGWTNNGPGRCTVYQGIDMNRNWSVGFTRNGSARNFTGNEAFSAYETQRVRDFILGHKGSQNILVDVHGWLNETLGDNGLGSYYRSQFGLPTHIGSYGSGYLINWARTIGNARSVLVELPQVSSHQEVVSRDYVGKFYRATMDILNREGIAGISYNARNAIIGGNNMKETVKEYDGREFSQVKPEYQFRVALAGVLKNNKPQENEIGSILENVPTKTGIWVSENSRQKVLELFKQNGIEDCQINEEGYLISQDKRLQNNSKLYVLDMNGRNYKRDEVSGEIQENPIEEIDPYQITEKYEYDNKIVMEITTNKAGKLTKEEIFNEIIENLKE